MNTANTTKSTHKLSEFATHNGIELNQLKRIKAMLEHEKSLFRYDQQYPERYIEDIQAQAWHDPKNYSWTHLLTRNFESIRNEALNVFHHQMQSIHPENDDLVENGTWNTFFFYKNGTKFTGNHKQCPMTSHIINQIPGVEIAGRTYFSAMTPGVHVKKHCGPHNFKLRTHLGIVVPEEAQIRVGSHRQSWPEGECIVFDDSFEHEVWNDSDELRIILIVDTWNPILTPIEQKALEYLHPKFYQRSLNK